MSVINQIMSLNARNVSIWTPLEMHKCVIQLTLDHIIATSWTQLLTFLMQKLLIIGTQENLCKNINWLIKFWQICCHLPQLSPNNVSLFTVYKNYIFYCFNQCLFITFLSYQTRHFYPVSQCLCVCLFVFLCVCMGSCVLALQSGKVNPHIQVIWVTLSLSYLGKLDWT